MPEFTLISHDLCPYVQRAVIALTEKGVPFERITIDLADKPDWFVKLSPLGRVPVLKTGEAVLFESQVIAEYLDEVTPGSLHPLDPLEKARHRSWIEFGSETLNAIAGFYNARDAETFEAKRTALQQKFAQVDKVVIGPFFAGETFHLIDGVWGTIFRYFDTFDRIADFGFFNGLAKVLAWRAAVSERPSVVNAAVPGYPERLETFLRRRNSHISGLMTATA